MNELEAWRWVQKQPGLTIRVGPDGHITLIYGFSFEITGDNIIDAVAKLQRAQLAKDETGCNL